MATLSAVILISKPTKLGKFPIFIRNSVKNDKEYIKQSINLTILANGIAEKVVARPDATIINKQLLYELKKRSRITCKSKKLALFHTFAGNLIQKNTFIKLL